MFDVIFHICACVFQTSCFKRSCNLPNLTQQGTLYTHSVKSSFSCLSFGCTRTVFKVLYGFITTGTLCFLIILATASETFST